MLSVVVQHQKNYHEAMATLSTGVTPDTPAPEMPDTQALLATVRAPQRPPRRTRSLAPELVEGIGGQTSAQTPRPADKLPTESEIMQSYGVSRTVVREALSRLQAAGLV